MDETEVSDDWLLWQLADSAFPTGGFGHSAGLEAAVQHRHVTGEDLRDFVQQALWQTLYSSMPLMLGTLDVPASAQALDEYLDAMLSNAVANRASRLQGQALLSTLVRVFASATLRTWREHAMQRDAPMHFPIVFGLAAAELKVHRSKAARLYLFITARGLLSAAVRLGVVGPLRAQQIQLELTPDLDRLAGRATTLTLDDAAQTSPLMELLQSTHDRLYSRLFQS